MGDEEYLYDHLDAGWLEADIWPCIRRIIRQRTPASRRVFELGCGNGATAFMLSELGCDVVGVDPSHSGIEVANRAYPALKLETGSAYDDLGANYGRFPLVISLEVVEHCYYPRKFARTVADLLEEDGLAIISTPYHGYWKNLALALTNKWDDHLAPLWDHGHIKFFSESTLTALMTEAGLRILEIHRVGRVRFLAKSMIMVAVRQDAH